jgi:hypothetical protein
MYFPKLALALGGAWNALTMMRGDARVQLELLLQLTQ